MKGKSYLIALILVLVPFAGLLLLWNPTKNGPDVDNEEAYFGCYRSGNAGLRIEAGKVVLLHDASSTALLRVMYLKNQAAINTKNNLDYNEKNGIIEIGGASSGFFYRFDNIDNPTALLVPDRSGTSVKFLRAPC